MDKRIRNAIAKIEVVGSDGKTKSRGTGSLVADDKVLTALHVVANRNTDPPEPIAGRIILSFPDYETPARIAGNLFDASEDWVLLDCQQPPPVPPIPLGVRHDSGSPFVTFGFPDANPRDGMVQTGTIEDDGANLDSAPAYQLFSRQAAAGDGAPVKGLSGAPVIIDGALVGLLRFALMDRQRQTIAGTLYACPLASVLERAGEVLPVPDPLHGLPGIPRRPLPTVPFRYLKHFTENDAEIFFGRSREIAELYRLMTSEDGPTVVLLYGQSGVGKSSFLDAGVVPRLRWDHEPIYLRHSESSTLLDAVGAAVSPPGQNPGLAQGWRRREQRCGKPLVVILDQVEEIYTRPVAGEHDEMGELCDAIVEWTVSDHDQRSRLLLSFRKEWYPEIHKQFELRNLGHGNVFLEGLARDGVLDVVTSLSRSRRLVQQYGLSVEPGLAEQIAGDLIADSDSPIAPTLQVLLTKMWKEASASAAHQPEFTIDLYHRLKHQGLLLGDFLDQQLAAMRAIDPVEVDSGFALDFLDYHTTPLSTARQRSHGELHEAYSHVADRLGPLLERMLDHYLLARSVVPGHDDASSTRLGHDTLAPLVRGRVTGSLQPGQRARRILDNRIKEWQQGKEGAPLDERDLRVVELGLSGTRATTEDEDRMLDASRKLRGRHRRNRRIQIGLGVAAMVAVVTASLWGWVEQGHARRQAVLTELSRSTDQVSYLLSVEPVNALMLSIAAAGRSYDVFDGHVRPALQYSLNRAVNESWETTLITHGAPVTSIAMAPGGARFASAGTRGQVKIWPVPGAQNTPGAAGGIEPVTGFEAHQGRINAITYAADGLVLATAGDDQTVRLWNGQGRQLGKVLSGHSGRVLGVVFGSGDEVISAGEDGTIRRWTREGEAIGPPLDGHNGSPVTTLAIDVSEDVLLSGAGDGSIRIWSLADWSPVSETIDAHQGGVDAVAISPLDSLFSSGGSDGVIRLWDLSGKPVGSVRDHESAVTALAFRVDGLAIVSGSADFDVHLIEVSRADGIGQLLAPPFKGLDNAVTSIALTPDNNQIIAGSLDGTIRIGDWKSSQLVLPRHSPFVPSQVTLDGGSGELTAVGVHGDEFRWLNWTPTNVSNGGAVDIPPGQSLQHVAISRDGRYAAGAYAGEQVLLVDVDTGADRVVDDRARGGQVMALTFGRDGAVLAVAREREITLLSVADGRVLATIAVAGDAVKSLVFSGDGSAMAGATGRCVGVWDLFDAGETLSITTVMAPDAGSSICTNGKDNLNAIAVGPAGRYLVTGDVVGNLGLWRRTEGEIAPVVAFKGHNGEVRVLAFRPDGRAFISGASGRLRLWNLNGDLLAEFTAKNADFLDIAFDADGGTAASSEVSKTVRVWAAHWVEWLTVGCKRLSTHVSFTHPDTNQNDRIRRWATEARQVCRELLPKLTGEGAGHS